MAEHAERTNSTSALAAAAKESVNDYHRVADVVEEPDVAKALTQIAERREKLIEELDQAIWRMDELTGQPDADLESLRDLKIHFEAFTHLVHMDSLLQRCQETNAKLSVAAAEVSQLDDVTADLAEVALRLKDDADQAFAEIGDLLRRA